MDWGWLKTMRPECTPLPIAPAVGSQRVRCARAASHKGLDRIRAKPQICAAREVGCVNWTRWGTEGFLGLPPQSGAGALQGAQALILMGDWCAAAQPIFENQVCGELDESQLCNAGPKAKAKAPCQTKTGAKRQTR
jgi:hypothetical protein